MMPDQLSYARDVIDLSTALAATVDYGLWALSQSSDSLYQSLGARLPDLAKHEAAIDVVLQRLSHDGLDPAEPLVNLRTCVWVYFRGVFLLMLLLLSKIFKCK
jgi:hypothetical protein